MKFEKSQKLIIIMIFNFKQFNREDIENDTKIIVQIYHFLLTLSTY
jgi:hypothetical protein